MRLFVQRHNGTAFWIVLLGITLRVWLAYGRAHWDHPDEWYQTLELGQILRAYNDPTAFGIYSQEADLHLRNLSLPSLFGAILGGASQLFPHSAHAPLFWVQFLSGLFSLGMPFALWQWSKPHRSQGAEPFWMSAVFLPWAILPFWAIENIKPSAENWSIQAFFWGLGFLAQQRSWQSGMAGFFFAATAAFKYPSALLVAGVFWSLWRAPLYASKRKAVFCGFAFGLVFFGIADWGFYGLPWESAWSYAQYNLFTDLGTTAFGHQSAKVYGEYLATHWLKWTLPLTLALAFSWPRGFAYGFSRQTPWFWALIFYTFAHLLVSHKEGRFLVPAEGLLIFTAAIGSSWLTPVTLRMRHLFTVACIVTFLLGAKQWKADLGKPNYTFFAIGNLPTDRSVCGVWTQRRMHSFLLPRALPQTLAFAVTDTSGAPVWDRKPLCKSGDQILLHFSAPSSSTGTAPQCLPDPDLGEHWFSCPAPLISQNQIQTPYVRRIPRSTHYPRLGASGQAEFLQRKNPPRCTLAWCGST